MTTKLTEHERKIEPGVNFDLKNSSLNSVT